MRILFAEIIIFSEMQTSSYIVSENCYSDIIFNVFEQDKCFYSYIIVNYKNTSFGGFVNVVVNLPFSNSKVNFFDLSLRVFWEVLDSM